MSGPSDDSSSHRNTSPDGDLEHELTQRLGDCGHPELRRISVSVDGQRVVLSGRVPTFFLKQMAQETARQVCPDRRVYNEVDVAERAE